MGKLAPFLLLLTLVSCSVKEDRGTCPCRLELVFVGGMSFPDVVVNATEGESLRLNETLRVTEPGQSFEMLVPRGLVSLSAVEKYGRMTDAEASGGTGIIRIRKGFQSDSIYTCHMVVDCTAEQAVASVVTKKQFAGIHLRVMSEEMGFSAGSEVRVRGNVDAFDVETSSPIEGEFEYATVLDDDLCCTFRVPRQLDSSLQLELTDVSGQRHAFAAGRLIELYGYDWKEDALKDILLDIDFSEMDYGITVGDWNPGTI